MGMLDDAWMKGLLGAFVLSVVLLVVIVALGLVAAASALVAAASGTPLLVAFLDGVVPYVAATMVVGTVSGLLLVGLAIAAVRRASLPRSPRLARLVRAVERRSSVAREVGLAGRLEPTTDERIDRLKRRYVDGELTEREYERRLGELLDDASDERTRRERNRTDREFEL